MVTNSARETDSMTSASDRARILRLAIVVLSLAFLALMDGPDLRRVFGHPLGVANVSFNYNAVVKVVEGPARAAGIREGDAIDLQRASPDERVGYYSIGAADAGEQMKLPMLRNGKSYRASFITTAESNDRVQMVALRATIALVVAMLGTLVLLKRPSPATWGFFFLMLIGCGAINDVYLLGPQWWRHYAFLLNWVQNVVPGYGALFFALYLLHDGPLPRWRRVAALLAVAGVALAAVSAVWLGQNFWSGTTGSPSLNIGSTIMGVVPFFVAPLLLVATYFESDANLRARLRWIIAGFWLSLVCYTIDELGTQGNLGLISTTYVVHSWLLCAVYLFMALPVAYAVLKHHIIDVNVAISRATVYTVLSVGIVGAFALVDLFFTRVLLQKNAGLVADVGLALVLGFSFNTMHRHVDGFVDRILFRARHRADEHIDGLARAMIYARNKPHACEMLLDEPVRSFRLTGAASIELTQGGLPIETLASYLQAERHAVRLQDGQWRVAAIAPSHWTPALALPVFSHSALESIAVYGLHVDGTDLDAAEVASLERLADAAGTAFDRLESEVLRGTIDELRARLGVLAATSAR